MWIKARHIQLTSAEECDSILQSLDEGADFAELAEAHSECPTASQGGDLGLFTSGQMPPAMDEVFFAEQPGIYGPVRTEWGFHILEILEQRPPLN